MTGIKKISTFAYQYLFILDNCISAVKYHLRGTSYPFFDLMEIVQIKQTLRAHPAAVQGSCLHYLQYIPLWKLLTLPFSHWLSVKKPIPEGPRSVFSTSYIIINKVITLKAKHFQCIYLPLLNCLGLIQQLVHSFLLQQAIISLKRWRKCVVMATWRAINAFRKTSVYSISLVCLSFCTLLFPADMPAFQASLHASDWKRQRTLHNSRAGPTQVPQKRYSFPFRRCVSVGYDAGVRGKNCSMPY